MTTQDSGKPAASDRAYPCQVTFFEEDHQAGEGTSVHFNERGMLIKCEQPALLNKRLKLVLRFPGIEHSLELQGIVVWTNLHGPADAFTPRGMGVKFLSLDRKVERLLAKLSTQYESHGSIYKCYYC
jgi:hypothetical protein